MTLLVWLHVIALVGALVVFALATSNLQAQVKPNLLALGLALLTAAFLFAGWGSAVPPLR